MKIKITPQININTDVIRKRIMDAVDSSLYTVATQVLKDSNNYAPERSGTLVGLSQTDSQLKPTITVDKERHTATIKWKVPYASYVYKGLSKNGKPLKYAREKKPQAGSKWAHRAKSLHLMEWSKMMDKFSKDNYKNGG